MTDAKQTKASSKDEGKDDKPRKLDKDLDCLTRGTFELVGGLFDAVGSGMRAAGETITADNITEFSPRKNGLVKGTFEGWIRAAEEAPKALRQAYETVTEESD